MGLFKINFLELIVEAKETKIQSFFQRAETEFVIPIYQRNYDWQKKQCETLLNDILEIGSSDEMTSHFIGSIVYITDSVYKHTELTELFVVDGQQRLTTLTLIYLALYKFFENIAKTTDDNSIAIKANKNKDKIKDLYLINQYNENENNLKLRPIKENANIILDILNSQDIDKLSEKYNHNILDNFLYFYQNINQENLEVIQNGLNKLIFVYISLEQGKDNPQRIFESLNSTGLDLNEADLIRNHILIGLDKSRQEYIYDNYWKVIENNTINKELKFNKVSDFIRNYLILSNHQPIKETMVYQNFKDKFSNQSFDELKALLDEIKDFSLYYAKMLNPELEKDLEIHQHLTYFKDLNIGVSYPFLMQVYHDFSNKKINKQQFIDVFEIVQSYLFRRYVVGLPTHSLNKVFPYIYKEVELDNYVYSVKLAFSKRTGDARFPNDDDLIDALQNKAIYNRSSQGISRLMYYLTRLEYFGNKEPVDIKIANLTIEHIFPQSPHKDWLKDISKKDYNDFLQKYLHTIGNLTLSGNNAGLGNKSFIKKRDYEKNGYKNSSLWINQRLSELDKWDINTYLNRTDDIINRTLQIWQSPIDIELTDDELVSIFVADDPTNKRIKMVLFEGEIIPVNNFSNLCREIFLRLLERDGVLLTKGDNAQKIGLTQYPEKLRSPVSVNDKWYMEGNTSSIVKIDRLKLVLTLFDLKDELLISYQ